MDYGITLGVLSGLFSLIYNLFYLIHSEFIQSQPDWGQIKFYRIWNEKGGGGGGGTQKQALSEAAFPK